SRFPGPSIPGLFVIYCETGFRMEHAGKSRYVVKSLVHAAQVLNAFRSEGEVLRLRDVVERTGFNKVMCFRILYTLHTCGFLQRVGDNQYRMLCNMRPHRRYRIGTRRRDRTLPSRAKWLPDSRVLLRART